MVRLGKRVLVGFSVVPALSAAPAATMGVALKPGVAATFVLSHSGERLMADKVRRAMIGPAHPAQGEITVGLAPAGGAVGTARLHVYENLPKAVTFKATAFASMTMLASQTVCGRLGVDAWVSLPAKTSEVVLSNFAETDKPCE